MAIGGKSPKARNAVRTFAAGVLDKVALASFAFGALRPTFDEAVGFEVETFAAAVLLFVVLEGIAAYILGTTEDE